MRKIIAAFMAVLTVFAMSTTTAFAAEPLVNSVGSVAEDITNGVKVGQDSTQGKQSEYTQKEYAGEDIEVECQVYATVADGSPVYNPDDPSAGEDGFVDGTIVVSVPTTIILDGSTRDEQGYYYGTGTYQVKGNISNRTVVNVVADSTFTMSQVGKDDINAVVEQGATGFAITNTLATNDNIKEGVTLDFNDTAKDIVKVKTNEATAGSWSGSFNWTISTTVADVA